MSIFDYFIIFLSVIAIFAVIITAIKSRKPIKALVSSSLWGLGTLFSVALTSPLTGFALNITPYTLAASTIFGVPGVICVAVAKMVF